MYLSLEFRLITSAIECIVAALQRIWQGLNAGSDDSKEPTLRRIDKHRMEFSGSGRLLLDAWTKVVHRRGKGLVKFEDIQAIGIVNEFGEDSTWKVILQIARSANIFMAAAPPRVVSGRQDRGSTASSRNRR